MSPGNADSFQACVSIGRPASALAPATLPTLSLLALLDDLECVDYQTGANPQSHI